MPKVAMTLTPDLLLPLHSLLMPLLELHNPAILALLGTHITSCPRRPPQGTHQQCTRKTHLWDELPQVGKLANSPRATLAKLPSSHSTPKHSLSSPHILSATAVVVVVKLPFGSYFSQLVPQSTCLCSGCLPTPPDDPMDSRNDLEVGVWTFCFCLDRYTGGLDPSDMTVDFLYL